VTEILCTALYLSLRIYNVSEVASASFFRWKAGRGKPTLIRLLIIAAYGIKMACAAFIVSWVFSLRMGNVSSIGHEYKEDNFDRIGTTN
jgi:hypothetical protein